MVDGAPGVVVPTTRGRHICWIFDDDLFGEAAADFLAAGLDAGERVLLVADAASDDELLELVDGPFDALGRRTDGSLLVTSARSLYLPGGILPAEEQAASYAALTAQALADGFSGFRVAANVTSLVTEAASRQELMRYESTIDRVMVGIPMSAMCAYDERVLGSAVAELACVHPDRRMASGVDPGFCLYHAGDSLCLDGEIDMANHELLSAALEVALAAKAGPGVVVDLSGLGFVDAEGLSRIQRGVGALDRPLVLHGATDVVRHTWNLLGFENDVVWEAAR